MALNENNVSHVVDGISALVVVGTLAQILPPIAAFFTIIWTVLRIYEMKTVQGLFKKKVKVKDED